MHFEDFSKILQPYELVAGLHFCLNIEVESMLDSVALHKGIESGLLASELNVKIHRRNSAS